VSRKMTQAAALAAMAAALLLILSAGSGGRFVFARDVAMAGMAMNADASSGEAGEGGGLTVTLDGRLLPHPAAMNAELSELRVSVRDVAEALGLTYRWDAAGRRAWIGDVSTGAGADAGTGRKTDGIAILLNGRELPADTNPILAGNDVMAIGEALARELGLSYHYDAGRHSVALVTPQAVRQFDAEERQVRDVLNGKGMTPRIAEDGTKEFALTAELHDWSPLQGIRIAAWTYNGQSPGPTIRVTEGDKVRIVFTNQLPEPSTIHWHGLHLPNAMDGVPGITQQEVQPGQSFVYSFTASHPGTFMYHSHYDDMTQIGSGLYGAFIIDPKRQPPRAPSSGELSDGMSFDHDYTMLLSSFRVNSGPEDEPDFFAINGRSYPDTPPLELKRGETARIRFINIDTTEVHTMHLHGMDFQVIARNGHAVPAPETMNTVLIGPGESVDIAFRADAPGKWMLHCHILDHTMNGGSGASEMGGLMTVVNVTE